MKKLFATLAVLPLLGLSGVAMAQQPVHQLTNAQMDSVTAGAIGFASSTDLAFALGGGAALASTSGFAAIHQTPVAVTVGFGCGCTITQTLGYGVAVTLGSSTAGN